MTMQRACKVNAAHPFLCTNPNLPGVRIRGAELTLLSMAAHGKETPNVHLSKLVKHFLKYLINRLRYATIEIKNSHGERE